MFTGIIEVVGVVFENRLHNKGRRLLIKAPWDDLQVGESIAVNGVCLTYLQAEPGLLAFDVSPETLSLTQLGDLEANHLVNLERALSVGSRFGGHYVSGHIDATATLTSITPVGEYFEIEVSGISEADKRYVLPKGSITLNGVSLTINVVTKKTIRLMLIPHTITCTTFRQAHAGQKLNVEFDYIARIIAHQLGSALENAIISPFARDFEVSQ